MIQRIIVKTKRPILKNQYQYMKIIKLGKLITWYLKLQTCRIFYL